MTYERTADESINEVLGRWTVTDLIEQSNDDLRRGDELFYKSTAPIEVLETGETGLIKWWKIRSGGKPYEVRRFKNFCFCSCKGFFFRKQSCKHISVTAGVYCARCFVLSAKVGKYCYDCDDIIHRFIKPAAQGKWEPLCESKF